jgi:hypothetical protein
MLETRQGGCARQGRADARGKAGQMSEAKQGRADARVKAGQMRESMPGIRGGKAMPMRESRRGR